MSRKASAPISVTVSGIFMFDIPEPKKRPSAILVIPSSKRIVLRCCDPKKAPETLLKFLGIAILLKLSICPKALLPISVTLVGRVTFFNCVPLKVEEPIFVSVLGNTTSFKLEPEKAYDPISVTL